MSTQEQATDAFGIHKICSAIRYLDGYASGTDGVGTEGLRRQAIRELVGLLPASVYAQLYTDRVSYWGNSDLPTNYEFSGFIDRARILLAKLSLRAELLKTFLMKQAGAESLPKITVGAWERILSALEKASPEEASRMVCGIRPSEPDCDMEWHLAQMRGRGSSIAAKLYHLVFTLPSAPRFGKSIGWVSNHFNVSIPTASAAIHLLDAYGFFEVSFREPGRPVLYVAHRIDEVCDNPARCRTGA